MARPRKRTSPPTALELELEFLVREGLVSPMPGGAFELTPDGRDWMLWSVWQALGCPGMPAPAPTEERAE